MTIFAVLMPTPQPVLAEKIKAVFANAYYQINDTQWLVSTTGTAIEICTKLGIADPTNLAAPPIGLGIVFATSSYYGRAPQPVWDWMKARLEGPPNA
jgi:hypothetical protein